MTSALPQINPVFQALIPPLTPEEYAQLESNLLTDGCRDPLVLWNGTLVDGHNRLEICQRHGLTFETWEIEFEDESEAMEWIIENQLGRRNLVTYVRGVLTLRLKPIFAARAKERMLAGKSPDPRSTLTEGQTRDEMARISGLSTGTITKIELIEERATPEVKAALARQEVTINHAYNDLIREGRRQEHEALVAEVAAAPKEQTILGPFDLILADPPWRYDESHNPNRAIENQYPTATAEEICTHPTQAADAAVLFLWATAPKLVEALGVLAAWGFLYRTHAVWDKEKVGMGYWFRGQHELLLVGTKGDMPSTPESARVSSVFREARGNHSRKPECVYRWIEFAFPAAKKLEMYCREPRPGWAAWGNEV